MDSSCFGLAHCASIFRSGALVALGLLVFAGTANAQSDSDEVGALRSALASEGNAKIDAIESALDEPLRLSDDTGRLDEDESAIKLSMGNSLGYTADEFVGDVEEEENQPWRLNDVLREAGTPDWLRVSGQIRLRYEGISGQFRSATRLDNSDHAFFIRSLLKVETDFDPVVFTLELHDGRQYGGDTGSAIGTGAVNAVELLQASVTFRLGNLGSGKHILKFGRQTIDLGTRRLVARNNYRNTINGFTGALWEWKGEDFKFTAFYTLPQRRLPSDLDSLLDNELEFDDEDFDYQFFGLHLTHDVFENHRLNVYIYGLLEDTPGSRHRDIFTAGAALLLPKKKGKFDYGIEGTYQFGESRLSGAGPNLDHSAGFVHVHIAYTFDAAWSPRLRLAFDYASGDDDPTDGDNNRFETLFGARRFEYGPTGIFGAIARFNLLSPELRLELKPRSDMQWMMAWRPAWIASDQDAWTAARVQDPTGNSGSFIGNQFETRWRWDILPKSVRLEAGIAYIIHGEFQSDAPGSQDTDTFYGYTQVIWNF